MTLQIIYTQNLYPEFGSLLLTFHRMHDDISLYSIVGELSVN